MSNNCNWITPSWPAPGNVRALTTVRFGGVSLPPFDSFNFGSYVGDTEEAVLENGLILKKAAGLPNEPLWLKQVHGTHVVNVGDYKTPYPKIEADASYALQPGQVCVVTTADCLPLLLCDQDGTCVSAVHAGWRGLAAGMIEAAVEKLNCPGERLMAWLGPAIGPQVFEVGEEVVEAFKKDYSSETFVPTQPGKWLANLYELARIRLKRLNISNISGGEFCTYQDVERFYSYRRSKNTGRMATLIWFTVP